MRVVVTAGAVAGGALVLGIVILAGLGSNNSGGGGCGSGPSAAGEPPLIQYDIGAAQRYGLGPDGYAMLAGINYIETKFGTDLSTSSAGALGWMQFEPGTWAEWRVTPSGQPAPDDASGWNDPADAIYSAARLLQASGAPADWHGAIFSYNHANWYVAEVEARAALYMGQSGLQFLASDIASLYGGQQPATFVGITGTTTAAAPATGTVTFNDGPTRTGTTSTPASSSGTSTTQTATTSTSVSTSSGTSTTPSPAPTGCGAVDAAGYSNPFAQSQGLTPLRIDMGVDYSASGPFDAVGDGTITYAQASGTGWGPFACSGGGAGAVVEQLSDGSQKGRWVYVTEGIVPTVSTGTTVRAGQQVATFTGCIEVGWADGPGPSPRAGDLHQDAISLGLSTTDPGADPTECGEQMSSLLAATGAPAGLQGSRVDGSGC
ncbi:MAG: lytic transglycosylase domain-containing protein [Solirubrobacteraceae bacterium]